MIEITEICDKNSFDEWLIWPHTVRSQSSIGNHTTDSLQTLPTHAINISPSLGQEQGINKQGGVAEIYKGFSDS